MANACLLALFLFDEAFSFWVLHALVRVLWERPCRALLLQTDAFAAAGNLRETSLANLGIQVTVAGQMIEVGAATHPIGPRHDECCAEPSGRREVNRVIAMLYGEDLPAESFCRREMCHKEEPYCDCRQGHGSFAQQFLAVSWFDEVQARLRLAFQTRRPYSSFVLLP